MNARGAAFEMRQPDDDHSRLLPDRVSIRQGIDPAPFAAVKNSSISCSPAICKVSSITTRLAALYRAIRRLCITGSASWVYPSCQPSNRSLSLVLDHRLQPARAFLSHMKFPPDCDWSLLSTRRVLWADVP